MRGDGQFEDWVECARAMPIEREIERRDLRLRRIGLERVGACPKCGGDDRFAINTQKQVFNCRGYGVGGDVIKLVEHLDGVDFTAACTTLAGPASKANGKDRLGEAREIIVAEYFIMTGPAARSSLSSAGDCKTRTAPSSSKTANVGRHSNRSGPILITPVGGYIISPAFLWCHTACRN
jgi:CHC2-type zinc finger protein